MNLEIITPEKKIFDDDVVIATFPGVNGSFQVMNNHAPLVSLLGEGIVVYKTKNNTTDQLLITGGVVEVIGNRMIALIDGVKK